MANETTRDATVITAIGTVNPDAVRENLTNSNSRFFTNNRNLNVNSPLVLKLLRILDGGRDGGVEMRNVHSLNELGITVEELRSIGQGVYNLYLRFETVDKDGKPILIDANEFMAWQGTAGEGKPDYKDRAVTADVWAKDYDVTLKLQSTEYPQHISIETPKGSKRVAKAGWISEKFIAHYGSIEILDSQTGNPITVGGDGPLDAHIPDEILKQIKSGNPYLGPVVIRSYIENEGVRASDPKVFFVSDVRRAVEIESATELSGEMREVGVIGHRQLERPIIISKSYRDDADKQNTRFLQLSGSQFQAWQYALADRPELRTARIEQWIQRSFGSYDEFNRAFEKYPDGQVLTREQYSATLNDVLTRSRAANAAAIAKLNGVVPSEGGEPSLPVVANAATSPSTLSPGLP